ncbi:uncharacterized protein N7498_001712 [Penicillium cinerascens]|uniref:Uncharacterized protein n=1 Tax=Penicillium cinerascens TaxID=70096 RepID=A0A9W9N8M7_9EURO|nr:uncharacterized protein N7498_001712 [Penicillium cinerascens]KAJ5215305.1 hypothetical protein N7498_001712 [Penicillium cinerascens]
MTERSQVNSQRVVSPFEERQKPTLGSKVEETQTPSPKSQRLITYRTHRERKEQYVRYLEHEISRLQEENKNLAEAYAAIQPEGKMPLSLRDENEKLQKGLGSHNIEYRLERGQRGSLCDSVRGSQSSSVAATSTAMRAVGTQTEKRVCTYERNDALAPYNVSMASLKPLPSRGSASEVVWLPGSEMPAKSKHPPEKPQRSSKITGVYILVASSNETDVTLFTIPTLSKSHSHAIVMDLAKIDDHLSWTDRIRHKLIENRAEFQIGGACYGNVYITTKYDFQPYETMRFTCLIQKCLTVLGNNITISRALREADPEVDNKMQPAAPASFASDVQSQGRTTKITKRGRFIHQPKQRTTAPQRKGKIGFAAGFGQVETDLHSRVPRASRRWTASEKMQLQVLLEILSTRKHFSWKEAAQEYEKLFNEGRNPVSLARKARSMGFPGLRKLRQKHADPTEVQHTVSSSEDFAIERLSETSPENLPGAESFPDFSETRSHSQERGKPWASSSGLGSQILFTVARHTGHNLK